MYRLLVQLFPNNELRQTLTKVRRPRIDSGVALPGSDRSAGGSLSLTLVPNSERPPTPTERKPTRFGNNARRSLMRAGGALDRVVKDKSEIIFLTGTLPGSTPEAYQAIADYAHIIVDRLKSWLSKRALYRYEFYVWELQKRGALHLHYAVHIGDKEIGDRIINGFKEEWCNLLDMVGKLANVNLYRRGFGDRRVHVRQSVQAYAQRVHTGVAAYLSKYCSKEAGRIHLHAPKYFPRRWWGQSRPLKKLVDSLTKTFWLTFPRLSEARSRMATFHDDLSSMSVYQYSYRHHAGVGETSLSYVLKSLWKEAQIIMSDRLIGAPSSVMEGVLKESNTLRLLERLTENYQVLRHSSSAGDLPRASLLMTQCQTIRSNWNTSKPDIIGRWVKSLCELSCMYTCNQYLKLDQRYWTDLNRHPVHLLLKLQEYLYRKSNYSWEDIKFFDQILDKHGFPGDPGTTAP